MASTQRAGVEYMEPHVEWIDSENVHVLVSGFKREELRVQVTSTGKLKISGERMVDGGRVSRFEKELRIPNDCDVNGITAKYESEILQLFLPKSTTAAVAGPRHSHELPSQSHSQLPEKSSHETHLPEKRSREDEPQLPGYKSSHETHLPEKRSHEAQPQPLLPGNRSSHETHLPEKGSHVAQPPQLPGYKTSHETQLHGKHSQLEGDISSHEKHFYESWIPVPDKHRPDDKVATIAAKHNVAQGVREAEASVSKRSRQDRKFDGVRSEQLGMEVDTRKTKVTIALAVVGALVVGYFSGRLDQAVRDGWTIVQGRS